MLQPDVIRSQNEFISFGKLLVTGRPGAELLDQHGIATYWGNSPAMFFNLLYLRDQVSDPVELSWKLQNASGYMRSKTQPGLFLVCDDYINGTARAQFDAALEQAGLTTLMETFGMAGDLSSFGDYAAPTDTRFERVTGAEGLRQCADINSDAYSLPVEWMRDGLDKATHWNERAFCYVAYQNDKPVSTASVVEEDGSLYVALVATLPEAQRRGLAEATMREALKAAHDATGCRQTSLHATQAGYAVYERMGYRPVTRIVGYGPADAADAH